MTDSGPRKNVKKNDKENKPFADSSAPNQPQSSPAPASGGLVQTPAHLQNLQQPARPSIKPQQPGHEESKPQAELVQHRTEHYELPTDGSRLQLVALSPNVPDYEQPMDVSIPTHWVSWKSTEYNPPGDFPRAVDTIADEWDVLRLQMSPPVGGGIRAVQALHPGTNKLTEPYLEVSIFHKNMNQWPEVLPVKNE